MPFWSQATEPLRKNRWTIVFAGNLKDYTYALKKVDKPSYKTTDITHKFGNYSFYYPGRVEWNTINMTFASVTDADGTKSVDRTLLNILRSSGMPTPDTEGKALRGVNKKSFGDNIGKVEIYQLAANSTDDNSPFTISNWIEKWTLINPFFTNIKFGDLSYDSEDIVDVECTVRFDTATFDGNRPGNEI